MAIGKGLCGHAPQVREICVNTEKLRGIQGDRERADIPDEGPGGGRGGSGLGRENGGRRSSLLIKQLSVPGAFEWIPSREQIRDLLPLRRR